MTTNIVESRYSFFSLEQTLNFQNRTYFYEIFCESYETSKSDSGVRLKSKEYTVIIARWRLL